MYGIAGVCVGVCVECECVCVCAGGGLGGGGRIYHTNMEKECTHMHMNRKGGKALNEVFKKKEKKR